MGDWYIVRSGLFMGHVIPQEAHEEVSRLVPPHYCEEENNRGPGWDLFSAHGSEHDGYEIECCHACGHPSITNDEEATAAAIEYLSAVLGRDVGGPPNEEFCAQEGTDLGFDALWFALERQILVGLNPRHIFCLGFARPTNYPRTQWQMLDDVQASMTGAAKYRKEL